MTANQLSYWRLVEDVRHNRASEDELRRHQLATESIDYSKYAESARHNVATETETNRTNVVNEGIRQYANVISQQQANAKVHEAEANAAYTKSRTGLLDTYGAMEAATNIANTNAKTWNLNVSSLDMEKKAKSGYWEAETALKQWQADDLIAKQSSNYWQQTVYNDTVATGGKLVSDLSNAFKAISSFGGIIGAIMA